ncbi:MAG TPA: outer membrane protein transport protein, partial [Thermoanaerobaculia bacterium]
KAIAGANTALPQEALDAETNPAAAAFVPGGYSLALALFSPDRQYTVTGAPSGFPQTFGLTPGTVQSQSKYFPMPSFGLNVRPNQRDAFAFNLVARGGMNTDYRTNTFYGSNHTGVDLAQVFVTSTYARHITQNQTLGITAVIAGQRFKASGLEAFAAFSSNPSDLTGNGYDTSYGLGFRLGYLARLTPRFSVGAAYAPQIKMSKLKKYGGLFAQDGRFDIPSSANVGVAYKIAEPLTISGDWQRIHYSDVRSVGNHLFPNLATSPLGSAGGAGFGWRDINIAKVGVQWKATDTWTWRAGFSKADQPIPSTEVLFNILAPGVIEKHFTAGGSKLVSDNQKFNFALMYAPNKTVAGANPLEAPGQQNIALKMHEWEVELGYTFGF